MTLNISCITRQINDIEFNQVTMSVYKAADMVHQASEFDQQTMKTFSQELFRSTVPHSNLYFANNDDRCLPLPAWGKFFTDVGSRVAISETGQNRLVVGLAIPTRTYAAALAAFGVVLARAINQNKLIPETDFERLRSLKIGTPVFYQSNVDDNKLSIAIYEGVSTDINPPRYKIKTKSIKKNESDIIYYLQEKDLKRMTLIPQKTSLHYPRKRVDLEIAIKELLGCFLEEQKAIELTLNTQLDCAIFGSISHLKEEINKTSFAYNLDGVSFKKGVLQDIVRVQNLLSSQGQAYRSEILPVYGHEPPNTRDGLIPHVTIFDGAKGFLKWRDRCRNSHWIILLDRTETHFQEAVNVVNNDYLNRVSEVEIKDRLYIPLGVELVIYQETRQ